MIFPFFVMNNAQIRQVKILIVSDPIACPPIRYAELQISMHAMEIFAVAILLTIFSIIFFI
jgi:hypothetical protein